MLFARGLFLTLSVCVVLPLGCSQDTPCSMIGEPAMPAIIVEVWEAGTGGPIGAGVAGYAEVGGSRHLLESVGDNSYWAYGPAGVYEVIVTGTGYQEWSKSNVKVTRTRCNVNPTLLRVDLRPSDQGLSY